MKAFTANTFSGNALAVNVLTAKRFQVWLDDYAQLRTTGRSDSYPAGSVFINA